MIKMIRRSNQTVHCATAVMIQMNAEISTKWKWKGGTNSYLNRNYVMGAMKRHRNHILLVIVQFEEPVRYVLVSTQLHGFKLKRKGDNSSDDNKTLEIIKNNCANISNTQCAAIGCSQVLSMCVVPVKVQGI